MELLWTRKVVHYMVSYALQLMSALILMYAESRADTGYYEFSVLPGTYDIIVSVPDYQVEIWRGSISADINVDFQLT